MKINNKLQQQVNNEIRLHLARKAGRKRMNKKRSLELYHTDELRRLDLKRYRGKPVTDEPRPIVESDPIHVPRDPCLVTYDD